MYSCNIAIYSINGFFAYSCGVISGDVTCLLDTIKEISFSDMMSETRPTVLTTRHRYLPYQ